jgi:hypothetical protein
MRLMLSLLIVSLLATPLLGQTRPTLRPTEPPGLLKCCTPMVYDATGKVMGELIRWDDRFPSIPLQAYLRYPIKGGGDVALFVSPESISGLQTPGGSVALFTTPDCSGNDMFAMLGWPPMMKRYAMVLPVASSPGSVGFGATSAWLWVTDPLPVRVSPGATVFHSQWGDTGACVPYPAPGYVVMPSPFGGFPMKRVEDLYAKFKRPYYVE